MTRRDVCLALVLLAAAGSPIGTLAAETPAVFHSPANDGVPGPAPSIPTDGSAVTLNLFIQSGPQGGVPAASEPDKACAGGSGDEICQWRLTLTSTGGVSIDGLVPAPGVRFVVDGSELRAIGGDPVSPTLETLAVGVLTLSAEEAGTLDAAGDFATSAFDIQGIPESILTTTASP